MGEVVNLRRIRKAKARADDARQADANRVSFGRSKAARAADDDEQRRTAKALDGHRIAPVVETAPDTA